MWVESCQRADYARAKKQMSWNNFSLKSIQNRYYMRKFAINNNPTMIFEYELKFVPVLCTYLCDIKDRTNHFCSYQLTEVVSCQKHLAALISLVEHIQIAYSYMELIMHSALINSLQFKESEYVILRDINLIAEERKDFHK